MPLRLMANSSWRDRIRQLIEHGHELAKLEPRIIGVSTFLVFAVTAANLFTHSVTLKSSLAILLVGIVAVIVLLTSLAYVMIAIRDRDRDVANLKRTVIQAYSKALEQSSFNPHRVEPHDERRSP